MNGIPKRIPMWINIAVFVAMEALLGLSIGQSRFHLGVWNLVAEMMIAGTMQVLVILFYMHVYWSEKLVRLFLIAGYAWLSILFTLVAADYATRFGYTSGTRPVGPPFQPPRVVQPW